jgi:hypothetical protein
MTTPTSPLRRPAGRYDERQPLPRAVLVFLGVLGALALVAFAYLAYDRYSSNRTTFGVVGFTVLDDHRVQLSFEVNKPLDATVVCSLVARDRNHVSVGKTDVTVGPADRDPAQVTERFETTSRATSVDVTSCSLPAQEPAQPTPTP